MQFFKDNIPCYKEEENSDTNTENNLKSRENTSPDQIDDVERFVHTILDRDDQEDIECKLEHNKALAQNTEMHKIHDNLESLNKLDKEKLEEMKLNYDPKSEDVFKEVWDLSDTSEDDTVIKDLYKELSNLKIQKIQDSNNSESFTNTVIEKKKKEKSPEREKIPESDASRPPIPGGQEYNIVHSLGMESITKLDSATRTEDIAIPPQTL